MKNFLIAFFVFLLWSIFGMWYHSCIIKEVCNNTKAEQNVVVENETLKNDTEISETTPEKPSNPFEIKDEKGNLLFTFPDNLGIKIKNSSVNFPNGNDEFNESIFKFLNDNQNKELEITGLFNSDESSDNGALGLKRANFIKDFKNMGSSVVIMVGIMPNLNSPPINPFC